MNGEEIRKKITINNKIIEDSARLGFFTLNQRVQEALEENRQLRAKCHHEFNELGYCIYCDYNEKDIEE